MSTVFVNGSRVIKLQKELYQYLKINNIVFADSVVRDRYRWNKEPFVPREQVEYLISKQKDVKLTTFDKGIVTVNTDGVDVICGVILNNLLDHKDLTDIELDSPIMLLEILYNILKAIKELDDNKISHLDLAKHEKNKQPTLNIMYKGTNIQLCDLSGEFVTYGDKFNQSAMYQEYGKVVLILINKLKHLYPCLEQIISSLGLDEIVDYNSACNSLENIKRLVK